ncbi:MAG: hypothetical protein KAV87_56630 [Desulfobacteraceae bacterium]|nr:hypothetical protein [Desulfobacteraceae bacterium]
MDKSKQTAGTNSNSQSRSRDQNVREVLLEVGEKLFPRKVSKEHQQDKLLNAPSVASPLSMTTSVEKRSSTQKSFAAVFMQSRANGFRAATRFLPKSEQLSVHCVASRSAGEVTKWIRKMKNQVRSMVLKAFVWRIEEVTQYQERRYSHEEKTIFNQHRAFHSC